MPALNAPHTRAAALLCLTVAVAVAGCGGSDGGTNGGSADPTRTEASAPGTETPPPAPTPYTADQLSAAMPTDTELPDEYTITVQCPGGDDCGQSENDNAYVTVSRTGQETEDFFTIGITQFPDAESAADAANSARADRSAEDGDFEIPAEQIEEGSTLGRNGTGALEDATIDDWSGYRLVSTFQYVNIEGVASATATEGYLLLVRGTTMASVQIYLPGEAGDAVSDRLDSEMQALFDRLGE